MRKYIILTDSGEPWDDDVPGDKVFRSIRSAALSFAEDCYPSKVRLRVFSTCDDHIQSARGCAVFVLTRIDAPSMHVSLRLTGSAVERDIMPYVEPWVSNHPNWGDIS